MQQLDSAASLRPGVWARCLLTLEMIKFEHSVFALPFALTGAMLGWRVSGYSVDGLGIKLLWILTAMVSARSAAMAFNRVIDAEIDARNPRTASRHIPRGLISRGFAWGFIGASSAVFLLAAWRLGPLCAQLSPLALGTVLFYSWTKRFTPLSHVFLGLALGIAPAAAFIAIQGSLDLRVVWLTAAVTLWTAGFDIIYSCQDEGFDRQEGLHSLPSRLGVRRALWLSRLFHAGMVGCLAAAALTFGLGGVAWLGIAAVAALLLWEHRMVKHDDLSRVDAAFFTMNGYVSILFFLFWAADLWLQRRGS